MTLSRISAVFFFLWGALHVVGGAAILSALSAGPAAGYGVYANSAGAYPPLAGAILAMNSFNIAAIGAIVCAVAICLSWRGRLAGSFINAALAAAADIALVLFLVPGGFVSPLEASTGIVLLIVALAASMAAALRSMDAPKTA